LNHCVEYVASQCKETLLLLPNKKERGCVYKKRSHVFSWAAAATLRLLPKIINRMVAICHLGLLSTRMQRTNSPYSNCSKPSSPVAVSKLFLFYSYMTGLTQRQPEHNRYAFATRPHFVVSSSSLQVQALMLERYLATCHYGSIIMFNKKYNEWHRILGKIQNMYKRSYNI
jgi:hypothetical protein